MPDTGGLFYISDNHANGIDADVTTVTASSSISTTEKQATVTFTALDTSATFYYGLQLALPNEVAANTNGADGFTGLSLQSSVKNGPIGPAIGGGGNVQLAPGAVIQSSISGYKWDDANSNTLFDSLEVKLSGWTIELYRDSNNNGSLDDGDTRAGITTTDSSGNYNFSGATGTNVLRGIYFAKEVNQAGWVATTPVSSHYHTVTINETTPTYTNINFGNRQIITTTVNLSASSVSEGSVANYTFTATLSNASHGVTTVKTDRGNITIADGATTGTLVIASGNGEDVYLDPSNLTATITSATGGNFENLVIGTAAATATVNDTTNPTTVNLSASSVSEGSVANYTFTATLSNASHGVTTVETDRGNITIADSETTGTLVIASGNGEDVYLDPSSLTATITKATGGNFEQLVIGTAAATATVNDTTNPTTVTLNDVTVNPNGKGTILTIVDNAVTDTPLVITLSNGATVTILVGNTSGLSTPFEVLGDDTISIKNATGGNYEHLDTTDTVFQHPDFTIAKDVTSVTGGAGLSADSAGDVINYGIVLTNKRNPDGCDIKRSICHGNRCNRVN
jgi:hypothetical protein